MTNTPPELNIIKEDLGLVSTKGTSINSQGLVQNRVKKSISRPLNAEEQQVEKE